MAIKGLGDNAPIIKKSKDKNKLNKNPFNLDDNDMFDISEEDFLNLMGMIPPSPNSQSQTPPSTGSFASQLFGPQFGALFGGGTQTPGSLDDEPDLPKLSVTMHNISDSELGGILKTIKYDIMDKDEIREDFVIGNPISLESGNHLDSEVLDYINDVITDDDSVKVRHQDPDRRFIYHAVYNKRRQFLVSIYTIKVNGVCRNYISKLGSLLEVEEGFRSEDFSNEYELNPDSFTLAQILDTEEDENKKLPEFEPSTLTSTMSSYFNWFATPETYDVLSKLGDISVKENIDYNDPTGFITIGEITFNLEDEGIAEMLIGKGLYGFKSTPIYLKGDLSLYKRKDVSESYQQLIKWTDPSEYLNNINMVEVLGDGSILIDLNVDKFIYETYNRFLKK